MDVRDLHCAIGMRLSELPADIRVQVYYFYSYGTAAWMGESMTLFAMD